MNALEKIKELIAATEKDAESFYTKKNKAAGTRLRKAYLDIKNLAAEGRTEVQQMKNEK
ncbi:histone H1 [Pedobacter aquatilis]|uniref:histone H1 n=1 Tax=Pedobacter aquatilis TaxID=351343 RepID=UPI00292EA01F|nr:histone H1 [Pedobacter aquatilis]